MRKQLAQEEKGGQVRRNLASRQNAVSCSRKLKEPDAKKPGPIPVCSSTAG